MKARAKVERGPWRDVPVEGPFQDAVVLDPERIEVTASRPLPWGWIIVGAVVFLIGRRIVRVLARA